MKSYDETVDQMICFLKSRRVCRSSIDSHKNCYQQFRSFMSEHKRHWEPTAVYDWMTGLKQREPSQLYTIWNVYMQQLEELRCTGSVTDRHLYLNRSTYERLGDALKTDLDDYLLSCKDRYTKISWTLARNTLAGVLIYFEDRGRNSIPEISYPDIMAYHSSEFCSSAKNRASYLGHARRFFEYMSEQKKCPPGYALLLNDNYAPYVGRLEMFDVSLQEKISTVASKCPGIPAKEFRAKIDSYIESLKDHGYAHTSVKTAKHALSVLYLFLDIHSLGYHPEIAAAWFSGVQSVLPKNWKHWRRLIYLFSEYLEHGDIIPSGRYIYNPTAFDLLPDWCTSRIEGFLDLLKREFHDSSTIRTYRYPCIRLCRYLTDHGHSGFDDLKPETILDFCLQDKHETFVGKASCFTVIRRFIIFLEDTGCIKNKHLHLCFEPGCASGEKIVDVLTEEQCRRIDQYKESDNTSIALRRIAMVMTGVKMGLRASDIINLKLRDIDWKNKCISIIQEKTKVSLSLPMPVSVGNAIYRYISQGRPTVTSEFVFIRHRAPYGKLSGKTCTLALWSILPERKTTQGGFHVTRRTFATNILRSGAGADRVMDTLGHTDPTSVMKYLSMDEDRMRLCPLSLSDLSLKREEV